MLSLTDKVIRFISKLVLAALIVIGVVMLGVSWAHIFCRYVLNDSLTWSEELLKVLVVWFCLLSATFISVRREHVRITIFKQRLPKRLEKFADLFVSFLMFFGSFVMCVIGVKLASWAGIRKTPALRIPFAYMYASIYVSFGIMALYELRNFLVDLLKPGSPPAIVDAAPSIEELAALAEAEEKRVAGEV
ncbi:MAG: TRAP transporter small permease [Planctomycetes bacterium]|nr:TRAP transporter small permease [Planctomycetota bacterium]